MKYNEAETYWDLAGEKSYATTMFKNPEVEMHVNRRLWHIGIEIGKQLGLNQDSNILDLGCGDGALSNILLSRHYRAIDGFDLSVPAVKRANQLSPRANVRFEACDVTKMDYTKLPKYDGAYLWGILHHVKGSAPSILHSLRNVTDRIVILEPNGNHLFRKLLEKTKTYKAAGEESFRKQEMEQLFADAGYKPVVWRRVNLFPNFVPVTIFRMLKNFEPFVEKSPLLNFVCTANMWGFKACD